MAMTPLLSPVERWLISTGRDDLTLLTLNPSPAFIFGDNGWLYMLMNPQLMNSMFGGGAQPGQANGGMGLAPLAMMASGSDTFKNLGTGLLLSNILQPGAGAGAGGPTGR